MSKETTNLNPDFWGDRMIVEYMDLQDRLGKLDEFMAQPIRVKLSAVQTCLLEGQCQAMKDYCSFLEARLKINNLWNKACNCLSERLKSHSTTSI